MDAQSPTPAEVAEQTRVVVEVANPRVQVSGPRCDWAANIEGTVSKVHIGSDELMGSNLELIVHGGRANPVSELKSEEPLVLAFFAEVASDQLTAGASRSDRGHFEWFAPRYVDGDLPTTLEDWLDLVDSAA